MGHRVPEDRRPDKLNYLNCEYLKLYRLYRIEEFNFL